MAENKPVFRVTFEDGSVVMYGESDLLNELSSCGKLAVKVEIIHNAG